MRKLLLVSRRLCVLVTGMLVLSSLGIAVGLPANGGETEEASVAAGSGKLFPDLIVTDIQWIDAYGSQFTSGSVTAGQPFETKVTIRNAGLGAVSRTFYLDLYVDGSLNKSVPISGLAVGASFTQSWRNMFCTGQASHSFRAVVDSTDSIVERSKGGDAEANNERNEYLSTVLAEWTVAFYLDGDNNLEEYMIDDFLTLSSIGSSSALSLVVLMDRCEGYDWDYDNWEDTRVFFITAGLEPYPTSALEAWGEKNVGDDQTLEDFGSWAFGRFGATKRFLVLDDHGSLATGVCQDDTSGGDRLTVQEQGLAIKGISYILSDTIDIVGYDACLMGFTEVFYESLGAVDYIIGSEYIGLPPGWPYGDIFSTLKSIPTTTPRNLATLVVQEYEERWGPPGVFTDNEHTLVAVDCDGLANLASAMSDFALVLHLNLPDWGPELSIVRYDKVIEPSLLYLYTDEWSVDLYNLAYEVKSTVPDDEVQASAQAVMDAVSVTLVDYTYGTGYDTAYMRALGIMFPRYREYLGTAGWSAYSTMAFPQYTFWSTFLMEFLSRPSEPESLAGEAEDDAIVLSWLPPSSTGGHSITDYHIYRGTVSGQLTRIASTGSGSILTWIDHNVTSGVTYYYRVAAENSMGTGDFSSEVSATVVDYVYLTVEVNTPYCPEPDEGVFTYVLGETATKTAIDSYVWWGVLYTFFGWQLDGQYYSYSPTVNVLMDSDHTLTAVFYGEFDP